MNLFSIKYIYFLGIGGIGMSALARYFNKIGKLIAGYDLTPTRLTDDLRKENITICFNDEINLIPKTFIENKKETLVVLTPAIPNEHKQLNFFKNNNFQILKRAEVLGLISKDLKTVAIAGTHGKTTTTTLSAHTLWLNNMVNCAFLGGISTNYNTNMLLAENDKDIQNKEKFYIVEADEFDRSFLKLFPDIAVLTSTDSDHLDIYGNQNSILEAFEDFTKQIKDSGKLIYHENVKITNFPRNIEKYSYSLDNCKCDFYTKNLKLENDIYSYDIVCPEKTIENVKLGIPGLINVLNSVAVAAIAYLLKIDNDTIKKSFETFTGVKRRFEIKFKNQNIVYIDDYAHHPEEIKAFLNSVKDIYKNKKITGIFQPHLYSRTRDFASEFANSLSLLDQLFLLDIYPAREKPIKNVDSSIIFDKVKIQRKEIIKKQEIIEKLKNTETEVLVTMGAGDIDKETEKIEEYLKKNVKCL